MVQAVAVALLVLSAWGLAWLVNRSLREVNGASMVPTLMPGERLLISPIPQSGPRRGDVVVVRDPTQPARAAVKRIIGLPGEQVAVHDGALLVGAARYYEPYALGAGPDASWTVPDGSVVVLGDNREASTDSRSWGPVPLGHCEGRMLLRWRPFSLRSANEAPRPA